MTCYMKTNYEKLYEKAFEDYLHTGNEDGLTELSKKVFNAVADIGYFLPPFAQLAVSNYLSENSILYKLANKESVNHNATAVEWIDGYTQKTVSAHFGAIDNKLRPSKLMINDSSYSLTNFIIGTLSGEWERLLNNALLHGEEINNTPQPRGILTYPDGNEWRQIKQINSGASGEITTYGLLDLQNSLMQSYQENASWLINRSSHDLIKKLRNGYGELIFKHDEPITHILGQPVHICDNMPIAASDTLSIAYGDFKSAYTIFEYPLISVLHDSINEAPRIMLYSTKGITGHVVNFDAIKLLKLPA